MTKDNAISRLKNWISTHISPSLYFNLASFSSDRRARVVTGGISDLTKYHESGQKTAENLQKYYDENSTVLDIGCGIGRVAKWVSPRVKKIWCVDISRIMIKRARKFVDSKNVTFYKTRGNELKQIPSKSVNFAYSFDMFPHISDEATYLYLRELRRVLVPHGKIYLQFANLLHPENESAFKDEAKFFLNSSTKTRYITPQQLEVVARLSGLRVIEIIPEKFHGRNMVLVAEKI